MIFYTLLKNKSSGIFLFQNWIFFFLVFLSIPVFLSAENFSNNSQPDYLIAIGDKHFRNDNNDSACYYYTKALHLSKRVSYFNGIIVSQIGLANCNYEKGEYSKTIKYSNEGLAEIKNGNHAKYPWSPTLYYLKGNAEYKLKQPKISIQTIETGIAEYLDGKSQPDSIYTLLYKTLGNDYLMLLDFNEAKSAYETALNNELTGNDTSLLAASLIMNIGIIYSQMGKYVLSEEHFEKSLKIKERKTPKNLKNYGSIYSNIGRLQTIIGKIDEALVNFNKAEKYYIEKYGMETSYLIPVYLNKGGLYILMDDFETAITYHEKTLELANRYYPHEDQIFSKTYGNLGQINTSIGDYYKALEWLDMAQQSNNPAGINVRNFRIMAKCYDEIGDQIRAREFYERALYIVEQNEKENSTILQFTYIDVGLYYAKQGNFDISEKYIAKAVELAKINFGESSTIYASALTHLGIYYDMSGNYIEALKYFQKSLIIFSPDFNDPNFHANPDESQIPLASDISLTLKHKARSLYNLYTHESGKEQDLMASWETSKLAIYLFENRRTNFTGEKNKLIATRENKLLFKLATNISLELAELTNNPKYITEAFTFSEKGKSAVLLSTINESNALKFGGIPDDVISEEKRLKSDIAIYTNLIYDENMKQEKNEENLSSWRNKLITGKEEYKGLISIIESKYPKYFQHKYNSPVVDLSKLMSFLSNDEALIEYDLFDTTLIIFTITTDSIYFKKVKIDSSFNSIIKDYIDITHNYPLVDSAKKRIMNFADLSHKLFCILLKPIYPIIKDKNELVFIPDDVLGYISFESLIKELPSSNIHGYKKLAYVIHDHLIRYSYSAFLLTRPRKEQSKTSNVLAIAPSYSEELTIPISRQGMGLSLAPLEYAKNEVENIQQYFSCDILEGEDATEKKFKALSKDFDILHFSMHTILNNEQPLASKLVFTLNNDSVDDGFLNTYEIYSLPFKAQLAVLSACETGGGKLSKGEGILSLARGFIYSGVSSIVMTLWEIDDISSADIISGFYEKLKAGNKTDRALRMAKLNYLQSTDQLHAHPYFWSAYVQIGDNSSITANSNYSSTIVIVMGIGFLLIVTIVIYLIGQRRRRIN